MLFVPVNVLLDFAVKACTIAAEHHEKQDGVKVL
jgi:hypothetical protein